jgi:hypothetical protein
LQVVTGDHIMTAEARSARQRKVAFCLPVYANEWFGDCRLGGYT